MNILITGGCGFLGSNIAMSYLEKGASVCVVDALFRKGSSENLKWLSAHPESNNLLTFYQLDIANENDLDAVFQKQAPFDYVCHLGGQVAMTTSLSDPRRDFLTNSKGTFNVLEAIRMHCPDAFLAYSSTNKVYGDLKRFNYKENQTRYFLEEYPNGFDESLPLDFASPYGCSKGSADQYVHDWFRNFEIKTVVFRHSSIYGGRQFASFDQGWIGWFCQKAIEQKENYNKGKKIEPFSMSGTGKQVRDVLHAEDLIHLYHTAYEKKESVAGEIFNIGGGIENSLSLLELFSLLEDLLEYQTEEKLQYYQLERRKSDQDFFVANISKAKEVMDWEPEISVKNGIQKMIGWVKKNKTGEGYE